MKGKGLIVLSLLFLNFFAGTYTNVAVPILAVMGRSLGVADPLLLGLVAMLPALTALITCLLSGVLTKFMKTKTIIYVSSILFLIGGLGPIFTTNITVILVFRAIIGLGTGCVMTFALSLIPSYFEDKARVTMMGLQNAMGGIMASLGAILGGILAGISWQTPYWIYAFVIVVFLLVLFFLPEPPKPQAEAGGKPAPLPGTAYLYGLSMLVLFASIIIVFNSIAGFMETENLGNSALAGVATSLITVGSFLASVLFGTLFGALKKWTLTVATILGALGIFLLALAHSFASVCVAVTILGIGMGMIVPTIMTKTAMAAPQNVTSATAFSMAGLLIGQFLSSFLMKAIMGILHTASYRPMLYVDGFIMAVCIVFAILGALRSKNVEGAPAHH